MNSQQLQLLHRLVLSEVERTKRNGVVHDQGVLAAEHELVTTTLAELHKALKSRNAEEVQRERAKRMIPPLHSPEWYVEFWRRNTRYL